MSAGANTFSFGRDFTKGGNGSPFVEPSRRVPVPYAEHQRLIEEARREAFEQGVEEGKKQQTDHEALRLAGCLDAILARLEIATIEMRRLETDARNEALAFARLFATKLAGRMIETAPMQAIEATAKAIFNDLRGTPHVAVRVTPSLVDTCKNRLGLMLRENGLDTKLFVFPDPDIPLGDCRIEWADGGIVREREKLEALIDRSVNLLFPDQD